MKTLTRALMHVLITVVLTMFIVYLPCFMHGFSTYGCQRINIGNVAILAFVVFVVLNIMDVFNFGRED